MSIKSMKWYIFNDEHEPLCWDGQALEFDTKESAERFLHSHTDIMYDGYEGYCEAFGVVIKECIFYYDGGYVNATNKIIVYNQDGANYLKDCEENNDNL